MADLSQDRLRCGGWAAVRVTYPRLASAAVRRMRFRPAAPWRRGVDADEVYAYLARIADEVDVLARDLAVARAEGDRVRAALRDWQTRYGQRRSERGERR
jgi:DivIVA domain-containing protein